MGKLRCLVVLFLISSPFVIGQEVRVVYGPYYQKTHSSTHPSCPEQYIILDGVGVYIPSKATYTSLCRKVYTQRNSVNEKVEEKCEVAVFTSCK